MTADPGVIIEDAVTALQRERALPYPFFIGGSGGLALRGLREAGDLDIGVATADWFQLLNHPQWHLIVPCAADGLRRCDPPILRTSVCGMTVDAWFSWRWRGFHETEWNDFNLAFREGIEFVRGIPCLKLVHLLRMKIDAVQNGFDDDTVRPKDLNDILLISLHLQGGGR